MLDANYKTIRSENSLIRLVVDIKKWFKGWDMQDLFQRFSDVMKYIVIEENLIEPPRKKWDDAKRTKLEYYIANVTNLECWVQYEARRPFDHILSDLVTNTSINSNRALTPICT